MFGQLEAEHFEKDAYMAAVTVDSDDNRRIEREDQAELVGDRPEKLLRVTYGADGISDILHELERLGQWCGCHSRISDNFRIQFTENSDFFRTYQYKEIQKSSLNAFKTRLFGMFSGKGLFGTGIAAGNASKAGSLPGRTGRMFTVVTSAERTDFDKKN
jgi:hypothetical protein